MSENIIHDTSHIPVYYETIDEAIEHVRKFLLKQEDNIKDRKVIGKMLTFFGSIYFKDATNG